jgi:hypothetical protein
MMNNKQRVMEVVTRFPEHFGLRAFPEKVFMINQNYSYVNDSNNVCLVIDIITNGKAENFGKCSESELKSQIVIS